MSPQSLLYRTFLALSWLACRLPRQTALAAGGAFARGLWVVYRLTPFRGFIQGNLLAAFGRESTPRWRNAVARAHLVGLGRAIAEILRFPRPDATDCVSISGEEHLDAARAAGKGVIVLTAHFGNWELLGATIARRGLPLHVLVQPPSQQAFDRLFNEFRAKVGVHSHPNTGPASLRPILRALARNEAVGLLADQHGEAQDAIVRFFGHAVSAPIGPLFLARRTGAALLPCFMTRRDDGGHVLRIEPALVPTGDDEADAQTIYKHYERYIRAYPDHWLWIHDRFAREHELRRAPVAPTPAREAAAV